MTTKIVADRIKTVCTTGKSRKKIASTTSLPIPGHAKIDSVITAPPSSVPICRPSTVSSGIVALRSAWRRTTRGSPSPLARPVRMYSWPRISSRLERVRRATSAVGNAASVTLGSTSDSQPARPEVAAHLPHRRSRRALGQQHLGGIARDHAQDDEDQDRDADEGDRRLPEPPQQVGAHRHYAIATSCSST